MSAGERRTVPARKALARRLYAVALGAGALASVPFSGKRGAPRVNYGGAIAGDVGGPLVKIARLGAHFPEHRFGYNIVYALSNAPYLPQFALDLLKRRRIPIVHNQNGVFYAGWYAGDWRAENARMARTYFQADHVLWQSEFCKRAADRFLGARNGPGEVLYNAVDTNRFAPRLKPPGGPTVFLATGKIDTHLFYRLESTLHGFARVAEHGIDARLRFAGWMDDAAEARARALAAQLGVAARVEFLGRYAQAEAPDIYRSADIYVLTKHNDPCPNAVIEAMACGLPVVYSASGGVPELVGDAGHGVPVPESWDAPQVPDAEALADAMRKTAADAARLGALARARAVERFDIAHWIARHRAVFERLTA